MVIWLDAGPTVSLSGHRFICRLLGPADWWAPPTGPVRSRQAASTAGGSYRLLITVVVLIMTRASSWSRGNSPAAWRAITIATPHHILINGAWAPGEGSADSQGPTPDGFDWWSSCRLLGSHRPVGPAASKPYRQAVVGAGFGPAVLMSGPAWQQCHAVRRSSGIRRAVAMPALGKGREWASL